MRLKAGMGFRRASIGAGKRSFGIYSDEFGTVALADLPSGTYHLGQLSDLKYINCLYRMSYVSGL